MFAIKVGYTTSPEKSTTYIAHCDMSLCDANNPEALAEKIVAYMVCYYPEEVLGSVQDRVLLESWIDFDHPPRVAHTGTSTSLLPLDVPSRGMLLHALHNECVLQQEEAEALQNVARAAQGRKKTPRKKPISLLKDVPSAGMGKKSAT